MSIRVIASPEVSKLVVDSLEAEVSTPQKSMEWIERHMQGCPDPNCGICYQKKLAIASVRKALGMKEK